MVGFFDSLEEEEPKTEIKKTPQKTYTPRAPRIPKPKYSAKELAKLVSEFSRVINSIHVNQHIAQRQTLDDVIGSFSVPEVRKWLINRYTEALTK